MGTLNEDMIVNGFFTSKTMTIPANAVLDAAVSAAANIQTSKLQHRYHAQHAQPNTTATTETRCIFVCNGSTGTLISFSAGSIAACAGTDTITVDLKKNGTSVLSAVLTLNSSNTARVVASQTIATPGLVAGDWLEVVITATHSSGTLGTGLFISLIVDETPS